MNMDMEWNIMNLSIPYIGKLYNKHEHFNCAIMVYKGRDIDEMVKKHYTSKVLATLDNTQLW